MLVEDPPRPLWWASRRLWRTVVPVAAGVYWLSRSWWLGTPEWPTFAVGLLFFGLAFGYGLATGRLDRPGRALAGVCGAVWVVAAIVVAVDSWGLSIWVDELGWVLSAFLLVMGVLFLLVAIDPDVLRHRWLRRLVSGPYEQQWESAREVDAVRSNFAGQSPNPGTTGRT